jgi:aminopeptidase YwaD
MEVYTLLKKTQHFLNILCNDIDERCTGSEGNRKATHFVKKEFSSLGWPVNTPEFDVMDWYDGGAGLEIDNTSFDVHASPYSPGCSVKTQLIAAKDIYELEAGNFKNKILLLYGDIAREQLMPKNFIFYNPESHQEIIRLLEQSGVKGIICATGRNAALAGGMYPFPLIEDGDFSIPSVYTTEEMGEQLLSYTGKAAFLYSDSRQIPSVGYNVIAEKGNADSQKIVITAHIDAKKGTPGAIDNATGVIVLLVLAELLQDYQGNTRIELVALNGEDHYAIPGQMNYIMQNQDKFETILLNINIDGAAYREGSSAFSFYDLPDAIHKQFTDIINASPDLTEGPQWPQGDHSIFVHFGRPAVAVTSQWFNDNSDHQDITHTPKDNPEIVDCNKILDISNALYTFICQATT